MKTLFLLLALLTNYCAMATDFLYYCDDAFSSVKVYQNTIKEKSDFNLENSEFKLTYNLNDNEASLQISGEDQLLTSTNYDEENKILTVSRSRGTGVGKIGVGYRLISPQGCDDKKARLEKFNIGGFAGGTVTAKTNCICSVD
jgi:hypothetical protein